MKLEESLKQKRFVVTSEIHLPMGTDIQDVIQPMDRIKSRMEALSLPELKIDAWVGNTIGICRAIKDQQVEPILLTPCREKSRIDLQEHLVQAFEAGIRNILTFTEDYRISGDSLQELMFFHVDTGKLFSVIESLRGGHDISGKELSDRPEFFIGSGVDAHWGKEIPDMALKEMEELARLGTNFFVTTPVFDLDSFEQFMKRVFPLQIPVIAEVLLVGSLEMGLFLNEHVKAGMVPPHLIEKLARSPDKERASMEVIRDLLKGLKDLCQGVHFVPIEMEDPALKESHRLKL